MWISYNYKQKKKIKTESDNVLLIKLIIYLN